MSKPLFVAVCGPSGVGKTAFVNALVNRFPNRFRRAKSVTTRPRREGEGSNEYEFINETEFRVLAGSGRLLNTDEVHGNWYGISADDVMGTVEDGMIPVKEMAAKNVVQLRTRGFEPIVVEIESSEPIVGRPGRDETDLAELGSAVTDQLATVRLLREGQTPEALAEHFDRWLNAALALDVLGSSTVAHSPGWEASNRTGYDAIAPEFSDDLRVTTAYFHQLSTPFWYKLRDERLIDGDAYLEVAPGRGWLVDLLEWSPRHGYRGLELSTVMRGLNPRSREIDIGSAARMPYRQNSFAGILGSLVDPFLNANFLTEAHRVLQPGGWLAFTSPASDWAKTLRGEKGAYETTFVASDGSSASVGSSCTDTVQLRQALTHLGFINIDISDLRVDRGTSGLPQAVQAAMDHLPLGRHDLSVVTTCLAEKRS